MKRLWALFLFLPLICGCAGKNVELDRMLALRAQLLAAQGCSFDVTVHADYGKEVHSFTLSCKADNKGQLQFSVKEPQSINGISGTIGAEGGKLTFDDQALAFDLLADGQLSPISAPWVLVKTLRGGYISSCGKDGALLMASIDDSYADDALHLDIWFNENDQPSGAEILWNDRRILSMEVKNFQLL